MGLLDRAVEKAKEAASDMAQRAAPVADRAMDAALDAYSAVDEKSGGKLSYAADRAKARAKERTEPPARAGTRAPDPATTPSDLASTAADAVAMAKTVASEAKLGPGMGRAWIEDGAFHFKRRFGVWGLPLNLCIPVDAITSVELNEPPLQDFVNNGQYSSVRIWGADGRLLGRIDNLMPIPGRHLHGFIQARVPERSR
jgi:hypothetical protein